MDIPEGRYRIVAKKNSGNIYNKYNSFDKNLDAEDNNTPKIFARLFIGDILIITDSLVVELSSEKANLLQNIIRRPIGKEVTLKAGNYICGKDFEEGTYDIELIKNYGYITIREKNNMFNIKFSKYLGEDKRELKGFKNCSIEAGDKLEISGGLVVKLTPSKSTYLYS